MPGVLRRYADWLHLRWPAGAVEPLPEVGEDFRTAVPGLFVAGDLTGVPLLKFAADSGARVAQAVAADPALARERQAGDERCDLAIVGAGVAGLSAALEARRLGLTFVVLEASEPLSTIVNFPRGKPIYTYPREMEPAGALRLSAPVKEELLEELRAQTLAAGISPRLARVERVAREPGGLRLELGDGQAPVAARRVLVAIGRSGNFRRLGVPGEDEGRVVNRLHDPRDYAGQEVLVVGGGDSAAEAALALAEAGARVTLSYRGPRLTRPKPETTARLEALAAAGGVTLLLASEVERVDARDATLRLAGGERRAVPCAGVLVLIGREPPLDFFRRSGVPIRGEWRARTWASFAAFLVLCTFVYHWKSFGALNHLFQERGWFPYGLPLLGEPGSPSRLLVVSAREPGFWYSLLYCACVLGFGLARIRRRRTPYVTAQTATLIAVQCLPLFLLPYLLLPWAGAQGWFDAGWGQTLADALFPRAGYGHGREYWRAFGLVLAWPLFFWNVFTDQPQAAWLVLSALQTFVLIPLLVWRWGKGAYCGWICSCGALAETLGDTERHKMPHGPGWNRLNLLGQVLLAVCLALLGLRVLAWAAPGSAAGGWARQAFQLLFLNRWGLDYYHLADLTLAGIVGVGCYFWLSGRVWCRFACPLAALMHLYARLSQFRILAEKKKCISCNVCTAVCHQGIDVMAFANKGLPLEDPECVRCSACVGSCPTGVLEFGRVDRATGEVLGRDRLVASRVRQAEARRLPLVS